MLLTDCGIFSVAIGFACTLIGFLLGNWLAIGRDRRKEWNDLINPVRVILIKELTSPGIFEGVDAISLALICERLPKWKTESFTRAIEAYGKSRGKENIGRDDMGGWFYKDKALISHAAINLLEYLKLR